MKEAVHIRDMSIKTYDIGDRRILLEGTLKDQSDRYKPGTRQGSGPANLIHDMVVRLTIRGPEMIIEKAEAEMFRYPREECPIVLPWISVLEGMSVVKGFSMRIKEITGGPKGCAHLTSLIIAMGPAAVQGYWAAYGGDDGKVSMPEEALNKIIDTCYVWREEGPLVKRRREELG
jgi:hypothetical protein